MSTDVDAHTAPLPESHVQPPVGLSSPPDSNDTLKLEGSDSELSDIEEPEEDIGDVVPDRYENGVPIYLPTMEQFKNFTPYMNKLNAVGMKTGIVKVIPPPEWIASLPPLDQAIKTIKVKDPIAQEIMGTGGTYRQVNIQHQRSYNLPQWRQLCEQSEHQPPAKRGERRANQEISTRMGPRPKGTPGASGARRRAPARSSKKPPNVETRDENHNIGTGDRLPTPMSPPVKPEDDLDPVKNDADDEAKPSTKGKASRQPKAIASVSSRRKYNRREAAGKIDEAAFKDFEYRLLDEEFTKERCEELERAYWKTLTYAPPLYGADMPGSLFDDRVTSWNLGKLDNLLDILGTKIPGVNTAYLYLGMWKATFAWHLEDVDLYSINYNHFGAPKQWYSISQKDARRFEAAMKNIWPVDAKACDQFLRHKTFLISPATLLEKYNVKVNKAVQHPGEFVITFPYGYHSGFNMGYNAAEAVNFATETWLEFGRVAKKCECEQAQDSVWIDDHDMRKLRGEETEFEESEGEEEIEDEDGPNNLPTPPESSGDSRVKRDRKRKRSKKEKDGNKITKRIRIRLPAKQPCVLCPNDIPSEPLLPTDDGRKAHRICASYIPETDVEPGVNSSEMVTGAGLISKARLELKCNYCRSKKGAAFQCSQKKCTRAYHATCAAAAGVFVEAGERPVFGPDGTEYKEHSFEFSCRFHRTKRDKKLDGETLEDDQRIRKAASELQVNDVCQFQYLKGDIFAGIILENSTCEEMLLVNVLPKGDRREVGYKWLLLPDQSDYRMPKPSASAIPLPKKSKQSLVTSKRQVNDLPRKEDPFLPGFTWEEFNTLALERNPSQINVDFSKDNQLWFYLGKTSTDARAQFTEDPAKPRHNPKGHFLDTIIKPPPTSSSRLSYPASHPSTRVNQNALNAARATGRPPLPHNPSRSEKPYEYKPRGGNDYRVDPQAYSSQQKFLQKSAVPYAFGSDPRFRMEPKWPSMEERTPNSYQSYFPEIGKVVRISWGVVPPLSKSRSRQGSNTQTPPKPMNPSNSTATLSHNNNPRTGNGARYYTKPNPFAKYPYLQKQHNRSPLDYKSPYSQGGGFMNGYEGNLKEHLKRNPDALFQTQRSQSQSRSLIANPLLKYDNNHHQSLSHPAPFAQQTQGSASFLTNPSPSYPSAVHQSIPSTNPSQNQQKHRPAPAGQVGSLGQSGSWGKKDSASLHPAIRQEYGTMFHHQYQPSPNPNNGSPKIQNPHQPVQQPAHHSQAVSQNYQPSKPSPQAPKDQPQPDNSQAPTAFAQTYAALQAHQFDEERPLYPHQQYFRNSKHQPESQIPPQNPARDVPDVPVDSTGLIEKMMANLREVSRRETSPKL